MDGWPVWLASASVRGPNGKTVPSGSWPPDLMDQVSASLDVLLAGVGDEDRQREFRMCITLCRHRALTPAERDALPDWWHEAPAVDIAGGPLEKRWSRGIPETLSTEPCANPDRVLIERGMFIPTDCGTCPSCAARLACHSLAGGR